MLKFNGTDTSRKMKYSAEADSAIKLYQELVNKGIISEVDNSPYFEAVMDKFNKVDADFLDEDSDYDYELFQNWYDKGNHDLSDTEILQLISECNGNAYYQDIINTNGLEAIIDVLDSNILLNDGATTWDAENLIDAIHESYDFDFDEYCSDSTGIKKVVNGQMESTYSYIFLN